jgi:hypothetical protein
MQVRYLAAATNYAIPSQHRGNEYRQALCVGSTPHDRSISSENGIPATVMRLGHHYQPFSEESRSFIVEHGGTNTAVRNPRAPQERVQTLVVIAPSAPEDTTYLQHTRKQFDRLPQHLFRRDIPQKTARLLIGL